MKNLHLTFKSPVIYGAFFIFIFYSTQIKSRNKTDECYYSFTTNTHFPNPIKKLLFKQKNNKVAAALAFPFPFGCVGLHRVYLGTAPHVPITYAATAGGVFGILPFVDCVVLLFQKDISHFENNNNVIMWIKPEKTN